jgi:hypothetical protein
MLTRALRPFLFAALAIAPALAAAWAQPAAPRTVTPAPQEETLEFETVHSYALDLSELGSGWALASIYPNSYQVGLEPAPELEGGTAAYIKALPGGNYAQGDLAQTVAVDQIAGKRIRISANIRNKGDGFAVFWMNAFTSDGRLLREVSRKLPLNTGWRPEELIMDVPASAGSLEIGVSLQGTEGAGIWLDRVALDVSGDRPPTAKD